MRQAVGVLLVVMVPALVSAPGASAPRRLFQSCTTGLTVGEVTYYREDVRCNDASISSRIRLRRANELQTDSGGIVKFRLRVKGTRCKLHPRGRLQVRPSTQIVISFEDGLSYCFTTRLGRWKTFDARNHSVTLTSDDPLFAVSIDDAQTVVKVELGFIEVSGRPGRVAILGPHEQVVVTRDGVPETPTPIIRTAQDQESFRELDRQLEPPRLDRPVPGRSETLRDIFARNRLVVGLETSFSRNPSSMAFITQFVRLVGRAWRVTPDVRNVSVGAALDGLRAGQLDLIVSADPEVLRTTPTIPLLVAPRTRVYWAIASRPERALAEALRNLVLASMRRGDYFALYKRAFPGP